VTGRAPHNPPRKATPIRALILALYVGTCLLLVGMITFLAVLWCHLSHLRRDFGPMLVSLSTTHGVHVGDLIFLGLEFFLVTLLTAVLIAGFTHAR